MPKQAPIRLDQQDYQKLREHILQRDGWRCQLCGSMSNLEVHHKELRSQSGEDSEQNLIILCVACHSLAHGSQSANAGGERNQKTWEIQNVARCGIWSYHHGDNEFYRCGPSHFWELREGAALFRSDPSGLDRGS